MDDALRIGRREFTVQAALLALAGVSITVSGCGGGGGGASNPAGPSGGGPTSGGATDRVAVISGNHGHSAVVTGGQLASPTTIDLDIRGNADHAHRVTLSADEVRTIASGRELSKLSTDEQAHAHTVTFRAGTPVTPNESGGY